jgi:hypothetical protein
MMNQVKLTVWVVLDRRHKRIGGIYSSEERALDEIENTSRRLGLTREPLAERFHIVPHNMNEEIIL